MEKDENIFISRNPREHASFSSPHTCATWSVILGPPDTSGRGCVCLPSHHAQGESPNSLAAQLACVRSSVLSPTTSWGPAGNVGATAKDPSAEGECHTFQRSSTLSCLLPIAPGPRSGVCLYIYEPGNCRFWHAIYLTI